MHTMQSQGWKLWETGSDSHKELCQKWDAECPWIHILDTHLDKFKESTRAYLEEQGKHFHQDMMDFERHNQGLHNEDMMGDCLKPCMRKWLAVQPQISKSNSFLNAFQSFWLLLLICYKCIIFLLEKKKCASIICINNKLL